MEQRLRTFVAERINHEASSGWSRLRRVPSTYTWRILDYLAGLEENRRVPLFEASVSKALYLFDPDRDPALHPYKAGHPEYRRMVDSLPQLWRWEYADVRALRSILADIRSDRSSAPFATTPESVVRRAESIRPTNAAAIRKVMRKELAERFGAGAENFGGGVWLYSGTHHERRFKLSVDYGGRSDQLRYEIEYHDSTTGLHAKRLSYEQLLGVGFGHWDFVTADNLQESVSLLGDFVAELVNIPERLQGLAVAQQGNGSDGPRPG